MANKLNPYLTFAGTAHEALDFYKTVFGGELTLQTFKEANMAQSPEQEGHIMHGQLITADNMTLMASDDPEGQSKPASVAVGGDDEAVLRGYWDKLSDGAEIIVPFDMSTWGDMFGMLTDKFGTRWLINATKPKA